MEGVCVAGSLGMFHKLWKEFLCGVYVTLVINEFLEKVVQEVNEQIRGSGAIRKDEEERYVE